MALKVKSVNLHVLENAKLHRTYKFENVHLKPPTPVLRRGQGFEFDITFSNRGYDQKIDKLRVLFKHDDDEGANCAPRGGAWITDCQDIWEDMTMWALKTVSNHGKTLKLKMRTAIRTPIGCWKMIIKTDLRTHLGSETYEHPEIIYLLLNPWHKDDDVHMPDTNLLEEYVMNDIGKVYVGSKGSVRGRHWLFGQFEAHVLPIFRELLKNSWCDYHDKGIAAKLSRVIFEIKQLLEGNWSGNYEGGTHPSMWTGSAPILKQYSETCDQVKYGQCWVFAAVGCSLCRAIGIPARVVSTILAAADEDSSLTVDKYFDKDGGFINSESEKIWNFHACTDVWMARPDLPPGYGGWQVIDPTNGFGPSSLEAVKRGEVGLSYDVFRKIAEINADVVNWKEDSEALLGYRKVKIDTEYVGYQVLTKKPHIFDPNGERDQDNVIHLYKNPEGSKEERLALYKAALDCSDRSVEVYDMEKGKHLDEIHFTVPDVENVFVGKNFFIKINLENTVNEGRNVQIAVTLISMNYNGIRGQTIKKIAETVMIGPKSKKDFKVEVFAEEYIGKLVDFSLIKAYIMATVQETKQSWAGDSVYQITKPDLIVEPDGVLEAYKPGKILFILKNPLNQELTECQLSYDCPGLIKYQKFPYRNVKAGEIMRIEAEVTPMSKGKLHLVALFHSRELQDVMGSAVIDVSM